MTLLEKAKATSLPLKRGRPVSDDIEERVDIALAYLRGEVTQAQIRSALGLSPGTNASNFVGSVLVTAANNGLVRIEKVQK